MPAKTSYPRVMLACPHGHTFRSAAGPGITVKCPDCLRTGLKVSVRMPSARPRNQRELTVWENRDGETEVPLSDKWESLKPWDGEINLWAPDDQTGMCPACGNPMHWERARTIIYCPECRHHDLAPNVARFYANQAEHKQEVTRPQRSKTRQALVEFGRRRREAIRDIESSITFYADSGVPAGLRADALRIADLYSEYLKLIRDVTDDAELTEILAELISQWRAESGPELLEQLMKPRTPRENQITRRNPVRPTRPGSDAGSWLSPDTRTAVIRSVQARKAVALPASTQRKAIGRPGKSESHMILDCETGNHPWENTNSDGIAKCQRAPVCGIVRMDMLIRDPDNDTGWTERYVKTNTSSSDTGRQIIRPVGPVYLRDSVTGLLKICPRGSCDDSPGRRCPH
jgi:hypothetical protein